MPAVKKKRNRLSGMRYDEVSVVDNGAGRGVDVVLTKSQTGEVGDMPDTIEKTRMHRICSGDECGTKVEKSVTTCPSCGGDSFRRAIVTVRKEVVDDDNGGDTGRFPDGSVYDAGVKKNIRRGYEDVRDAPDNDEEEEDEEDEEPQGKMSKKLVSKKKKSAPAPEPVAKEVDGDQVGVDALAVSVAFADRIKKIFTDTSLDKRHDAYEQAMTEWNAVMDNAAENWFDGNLQIEKSVDQQQEILDRVAGLVGTEGGVTKREGEEQDIFKGLTPEAAKIVKDSQEMIEKNTQKEWEEKAETFDHLPGDPAELGKSLRTLHEADPDAYKKVEETLNAANYNLQQSDIFKSHGLPGGRSGNEDPIEKRADDLVEKGDFKTRERALVHLYEQDPGKYYRPTAQ